MLPVAVDVPPMEKDWLLGARYEARIERTADEVVLTNGLVERRIQLRPFVGTTSLLRLDTGEQFVRTVEPEGRLTLSGRDVWLGGVTSVPNKAYLLPEWIPLLQPHPQSLPLVGVTESDIPAPVPYRPAQGQTWPPAGKAVVLTFQDGSVRASVRIEVYSGLPVFGKQVTVTNQGPSLFRMERFTSERLSLVEGESTVELPSRFRLPNVSVFTNMSFGGSDGPSRCARWETDPTYETQVNYAKTTPCVLDVQPPTGPGLDLSPGDDVDSVRSYLLLHDTDDRERRSLAQRKFYRALAPWTQQNPIIFHLRSIRDEDVRRGIDQAAECGFELVILSFGSGLNMEDTSPANLAKFKALNDYAQSKGVRLGGYSLLASRRIDDANDVINPATGKTGGAIFGNSPCLGSSWGIAYFEKIKTFLAETGMSCLEHDGNYPGDVCASTSHPGHRDLADSQWKQHRMIADFYAWCRERDIYLNVPDFYYLNGSNKNGMGYRETNWSLPREQQHLHARQNLFDGTFDKTPSMGWMFVPLVEYHGGGPAATIEPLKEHLADYELHFANTFGYGAQACWRGVQLYDAPETKAMVQRMVGWFKRYRAILESDVIHLRRPDGRRLDFVLHANPALKEKAMLVVYNPTDRPLIETLRVPLTYAGSPASVRVREKEGNSRTVKPVRGVFEQRVTVPSRGWTYFVVE